jgi:hypothetical protein
MSYEIEKRLEQLQKFTQHLCNTENEKPENEEEEAERQYAIETLTYEIEEITKELKIECACAGEQIEKVESFLGITEEKGKFPMWTIR